MSFELWDKGDGYNSETKKLIGIYLTKKLARQAAKRSFSARKASGKWLCEGKFDLLKLVPPLGVELKRSDYEILKKED
jgi:hypothetical protein